MCGRTRCVVTCPPSADGQPAHVETLVHCFVDATTTRLHDMRCRCRTVMVGIIHAGELGGIALYHGHEAGGRMALCTCQQGSLAKKRLYMFSMSSKSRFLSENKAKQLLQQMKINRVIAVATAIRQYKIEISCKRTSLSLRAHNRALQKVFSRP